MTEVSKSTKKLKKIELLEMKKWVSFIYKLSRRAK